MTNAGMGACAVMLVAAVVATPAGASGAWQNVISEHFSSDPSGDWAYSGVQNAASQDLLRWDSGAGSVTAEWDQSNHYLDWDGAAMLDPYEIVPSSLSRSLPRTLTSADTFRFGATLRIDSLANTTEFYQVANFGLYNLAATGPDRAMADDISGNAVLVKDACDFVEFNYFIQNDSYGFNPMTQATIGPHSDSQDGLYCVGSSGDEMWHDTDMGAGHWLPAGTDLFVEVVYDAGTRRASSAIYTDAARTQMLAVNGVQQHYFTVPLDEAKDFTLTDLAMWNYVGSNWGGANGSGSGSFDDLYVDVLVPEPATVAVMLLGAAAVLRGRRRAN